MQEAISRILRIVDRLGIENPRDRLLKIFDCSFYQVEIFEYGREYERELDLDVENDRNEFKKEIKKCKVAVKKAADSVKSFISSRHGRRSL